MNYLAGFDIGGTKIAITLARLYNGTIELQKKRQLATPKGLPWQSSLELIANTFLEMLSESSLSLKDFQGIGISCGGPLDSKSGTILCPPNLPGWTNVPVTEYFSSLFHIPCFLQNDADACALAEWKFGAGRHTENMVFLTFGTGFGAGLILNGKLYSGASNLAGELGHCRASQARIGSYAPVGYGKAGSFEGFCSGGGIAELGRSMVLERFQQGLSTSFCPNLTDLPGLTAKTIGKAAEAGDPVAQEIYRLSGLCLGSALSVLVDLLNPEKIVIGSIYARCTQLLRQPALQVLEQEALARNREACQIVPAMLGESLGDVAALTVALSGNAQVLSIKIPGQPAI